MKSLTSGLKLAAASIALVAASSVSAQLTGPIKTQDGLVEGVPGKVPGVTVFKGLPFGAPPVGDLRWKAPQPVQDWTGVRMADSWGNVCIQPTAPQRFPVNSATDMPDSPAMSEDCLYLNVWTPAKAADANLPVMVWLYGGAYNEGGGNAPFSEGDNLAAKGVIMVTLNYRVGSLGFLSHPELTAESPHGASGNYALMDVVAALQWIKDNIKAFGGDPSRVTIFGESAGSAMVGGLTGAPPANGLFQRGIAESGAWMGLGIATMMPREAAEKMTVDAMEKAGIASLADLRKMDAKDVFAKIRGQGMIVDGYVIPEDLTKTFAAGRQNKVDVIVGSNGDEGSFTAAFGPPATLDSWTKGEQMRWGDFAEMGRAAYPASTDAEAKEVSIQPFSDTLAWHMRLYADLQAKTGANSWFYWFTHRPPYDDDKPNLLSAHTGEIPYVFDNLAAPRTFPGGSSVAKMAGNPVEEAFADQVSGYWVNFAKTGNPNGDGLPKWPTMAELSDTEAMILDADGSGKGQWLSQSKVDLYDAMFNARVAQPLGVSGVKVAD